MDGKIHLLNFDKVDKLDFELCIQYQLLWLNFFSFQFLKNMYFFDI